MKFLNHKEKDVFFTISFIFLLGKFVQIIYISKLYFGKLMIFEIVNLIIYYIIISKNIKLIKKQNLLKEKVELLNFYNKNLIKNYDEVSAFKHDFNNIMQAIGGYIAFDDFNGLKEYYRDLVNESNSVKNLTFVNATMINDFYLCNIVSKKIDIAHSKGITIEFLSSINFKKLVAKHREIRKVMEVFLEHSIELAEASNNKEILVNCIYDPIKDKNIIILANSYQKENIVLSKEELTKSWKKEIMKLVKKRRKIDLHISVDESLLVQELVL